MFTFISFSDIFHTFSNNFLSEEAVKKKLNIYFKERSMNIFRLCGIKHDDVGFYGVLLYTCNKEFILFWQILGQRTN